jgi:hypothetical protein
MAVLVGIARRVGYNPPSLEPRNRLAFRVGVFAMTRPMTLLVLALLTGGEAPAELPAQERTDAQAKSPTPSRPPANRLAKETSPYLLQHAHNPVDWHPWGPQAFETARKENKPIFLSVGYSSCYWCHVMERESFEDEAIARFLNANFVCVKVDREERPDVDAVYMAALRSFSGGGGWPMSMFLFPDGRPFFGGTYFPPREKNGLPGFDRLLEVVADAWRNHRDDLNRDADALVEAARRSLTADAQRKAPLSRAMADEGLVQLAAQFDPEHGGFGFNPDQPRRPKFPEPVNLVFLLDRHRRASKNPQGVDPLGMLTKTLDRLARGGIRDHLAGGYHRYSVDRQWAVPHFEKMLYDNAQLASVFLVAFEITRDPRWEREAREIFRFVSGSMTDPEGGFFSALDAEAEAEEGKTYVWARAEVREVLGDADAETFAAVYGLNLGPNFEESRYVPLLPRPLDEAARDLNLTPEALEARLAPIRARLLQARSRRPQPFLDDKILTSWNGLMIAAYADGYRVLKDESYREAAEKAADFLWKTARDQDGRLLRTYRAGQAKGAGYLEDYAFLAHGLLRLHAATGDARRLDQARQLTDRMLDDFADDQQGGYFATADGHERLFARPKDPFDNAIPSGNSVAILNLIELARLTGETRYLDAAAKALEAFSATLHQFPSGAPLMLVALEAYLDARETPPVVNPLRALRPPAAPADPETRVVTISTRAPERIARGTAFEVTLILEIQPGWHVYANPSGSESAPPTRVELRPGSPVSLNSVTYPNGVAKMLAANAGESVKLYEGRVALVAQLQLDPNAPPGPITIPLRLRYQPCDDRQCLAPTTLDLSLPITTQ